MSLTYGFYNSIGGDRKYNALQMSSIFDGIIKDGVYMTIGDALAVKQSSGMTVTIGEGRAWFNHTWTLNDSLYPITLDASDVLLNRIDAIILEVNANTTVRANSFKIVKGTPATNPAKPTMIKGELLNQHPLAYITVGKGVTSITQANIENAIGTSACPYVTGVLKGMDIDNLIAQWGTQWAEWLSSNTDAWKAFMSGNTNEWKSFMAKNKDEWSDLINGNTSEFETWFEHMKDQLSEDAAGNLQLQVDNLNNAALGGDFVLKGSSVSVEYMGANRIASITAYGENAQGGTTEAPVALTGVDSVFVGGNNLLPKATETKTLNGVTFTPNPDGSVSVSGTATNNAAYVFANGLDDSLFGQTVCLSGGSMQTQLVINEKKPSGEWLRNVIINAKTPTAVGVLSRQADDNILYGTIYVPTGTTVNATIYPMLNLGTTALPYEPYQGSVTQLPIPRPLHEVGDVMDVCRTRVKSVYDKRIVLNGSEDWKQSGAGVAYLISCNDIALGNHIESSYLMAKEDDALYSREVGIAANSKNGTIRVYLPNNANPTTFFASNPLTVYYQSTSYNGTNGLDVCLTEYQTGFLELDGTENWSWNTSTAVAYIGYFLPNNKTGVAPVCSHYQGTGAVVPAASQVAINELGSLIIKDTSWKSVEDAKAYFAAQKEAGTPVQIAYQLATPETYATDPVDFDNAAGPVTVMTGGEVRVEISDGLSNLEQEIDKKAPIDHASSNTTYGTGNATKFGHLKLSDSTVSGSNADAGVAATPKAVNDVHAKANAAQSTANAAMPKAGGTFTGNVAARSANTAGAYIRNIRVQDGPGNQFNTNFIIMVRK